MIVRSAAVMWPSPFTSTNPIRATAALSWHGGAAELPSESGGCEGEPAEGGEEAGEVGERVGRVGEVAVPLEAGEGADRLADLVDDGGADTRADRAEEGLGDAVDRHDPVLVVRAVERHAPHLVAAERAGIGEGEVEALVRHLAEVADGRAGHAGR